MTTATSRRALVVLALAILVAAGSVTAPVAPMAATASEPEPAVSDAQLVVTGRGLRIRGAT